MLHQRELLTRKVGCVALAAAYFSRSVSFQGIANRSSCCRASELCPVRVVNPFNELAIERVSYTCQAL